MAGKLDVRGSGWAAMLPDAKPMSRRVLARDVAAQAAIQRKAEQAQHEAAISARIKAWWEAAE